MKVRCLIMAIAALTALAANNFAHAEITRHGGSNEALPDKQYIHVVSEADSPVDADLDQGEGRRVRRRRGAQAERATVPFRRSSCFTARPAGAAWINSSAGRAAIMAARSGSASCRKATWSSSRTIAAATGEVNTPSSNGMVTAIDDGITVIDYVQNLPYVVRGEVSVYGVSLGGNLAMFLASRVPTLHAVVAGAPAPIWFLGYKLRAERARPGFREGRAGSGDRERRTSRRSRCRC